MARDIKGRTREAIYEEVVTPNVVSTAKAGMPLGKKPYIYCEGQTERYFLGNILDNNEIEYEFDPKYRATTQLTDLSDKIQASINQATMIFCFFDLDRIIFENKNDEEQKYKDILKEYSANPNVVFCESLPSIEYWVVLNFEALPFDFPLGLTRQSKVEDMIKKEIPIYKKGIPKPEHDWYPKFKEIANILLAKNRANDIASRIQSGEKLSFSNAYKLLDYYKINNY